MLRFPKRLYGYNAFSTCKNKIDTSGIDTSAEEEAEKFRKRFKEMAKIPSNGPAKEEYVFKRDRERIPCNYIMSTCPPLRPLKK